MRMSESIDQLAAALSKAQAEMGKAPKDSDNPFFKSKYADLATVVTTATPVLAKYDLSVSQACDESERGVTVVTVLMHKSGQWISSRLNMIPAKNDPQGIGSAITYARRYAYMGIIGLVAEEDDDGNKATFGTSRPQDKPVHASKPSQGKPAQKKTSAKETQEKDEDPKLDVLRKLYSRYVSLGLKKDQILKRWIDITGKDTMTDMDDNDVKAIQADIQICEETGEVPELLLVERKEPVGATQE